MGLFYRMSEKANVIMGPAASDAAREYEVANWIGIHLTSDASLEAARLIGEDPEFDYVLVDYDVPMKAGTAGTRTLVADSARTISDVLVMEPTMYEFARSMTTLFRSSRGTRQGSR
jgi:hypothetical protein